MYSDIFEDSVIGPQHVIGKRNLGRCVCVLYGSLLVCANLLQAAYLKDDKILLIYDLQIYVGFRVCLQR